MLYGVNLAALSPAEVAGEVGVAGADVEVGVGMMLGVEFGENDTGAVGMKIRSTRALMIVTLICIERRSPRKIVGDARECAGFGFCAVHSWV